MSIITLAQHLRSRFRSDDMLRHSILLFTSMLGIHICNLAYQMTVSRFLPENEFALLTAILAVLGLCSHPLNTVNTAIIHHVSLLARAARIGDATRLIRKWLLITGSPAIILATLFLLLNIRISSLLHLDREAPIIVAGLIIFPLFLTPVLGGAAHGLQYFGISALSGISGALLRVIATIAMMAFVFPASGWALLGHGAGAWFSLAILATCLFYKLRTHAPGTVPLPSLRLYIGMSFGIQLAYAVLMTADVVLVKHYMPDATEFAYAATLGRMVVFLPMAITMAMFPKVSSNRMMTREHQAVFFKAFGVTALCVITAATACLLLPRLLLHAVFGVVAPSAWLVTLTRMMAVVMGISGLLNVTLQFLLAQRRFKACLPVILGAVFYLLTTAFVHRAAWQIAAAAAAFNLFALLACLVAVAHTRTSPSS